MYVSIYIYLSIRSIYVCIVYFSRFVCVGGWGWGWAALLHGAGCVLFLPPDDRQTNSMLSRFVISDVGFLLYAVSQLSICVAVIYSALLFSRFCYHWVLKRYTELAFLRLDAEAIGSVDVHCGNHGVGPHVLFSSPQGLVMERLDGRTLEDGWCPPRDLAGAGGRPESGLIYTYI